MYKLILALSIFLIIITSCKCYNKYSKEANEPTNLTDRQFRMAKINMIWDKAKNRLGASKLQTLYKDLIEQDKLELALKKLKAEKNDKDGLKEMEVKSKLNVILAKYDLRDVFSEKNESKDDLEINNKSKQLFKDKNLDKLWIKALESKFSDEELKILKEELQHYEDKLSDYHKLIDKVHDLEDKTKLDKEKWENSIERQDNEHEYDKSTNTYHEQHLNEKHKDLKQNYFRLQDKVLKKEELNKNRLFEEDDAQKLWQVAQNANFDETELEVIKRELFHFEHRLKKLNHLTELTDENEFTNKYKDTMDVEENKFVKNRIKELTNQIEKLRSGIEQRIVYKHSEL